VTDLRLYDTMAGAVREFVPVRDGHVSIYLCGATVQGLPRPHGVGQDGSPGLAPFHSVKSRWSRLPVAAPSP
jgi:hypothetical protein